MKHDNRLHIGSSIACRTKSAKSSAFRDSDRRTLEILPLSYFFEVIYGVTKSGRIHTVRSLLAHMWPFWSGRRRCGSLNFARLF